MQTIVLHLDMNCYFASVEQQDNPKFRGLPVGVCEHLGGIIISPSREAKKQGVKTAMPVWEAKKICPQIVLVKTRGWAYKAYTKKMLELVSEYSSKVELASIDEVFLDLTRVSNIQNVLNPYEEAVRIALEIKQRMQKNVGNWLTCSVGIADNKLLAKIASDFKKPNGLVVVSETKQELNYKNTEILWLTKEDLYEKLELTDIPGIGHRQEKRLRSLGIFKVKDLKNYPQANLERIFGIQGRHLYNMGQLQGSWKAEVKKDEDIKSIGHMYTLPKDFRKPELFEPVLYKLCEMVGKRLRNRNLQGGVISLYIKAETKSQSWGGSYNLGFGVSDGRDIFLQCFNFLNKAKSKGEVVFPKSGFKMIGITVSELKTCVLQQSLFKEDIKKVNTTKALDKINNKYGDFTIFRAPVLASKSAFSDSIGFGRIKEL